MPPFHSVSCTRVSVDTPCFVSVVLSKCVIRAQLARRGLLAGGGFLMCGLWLLPVYTHRFFFFGMGRSCFCYWSQVTKRGHCCRQFRACGGPVAGMIPCAQLLVDAMLTVQKV